MLSFADDFAEGGMTLDQGMRNLVDGYVIGVGLNTIEWWGTAIGTAAGEATYHVPESEGGGGGEGQTQN